ncbi:hypothetical protein ACVXHB_17285 [Escherichia coli]
MNVSNAVFSCTCWRATVVHNQNRQQNRVRIFQSGLRFRTRYQAPLGIRQDLDVSRCDLR